MLKTCDFRNVLFPKRHPNVIQTLAEVVSCTWLWLFLFFFNKKKANPILLCVEYNDPKARGRVRAMGFCSEERGVATLDKAQRRTLNPGVFLLPKGPSHLMLDT